MNKILCIIGAMKLKSVKRKVKQLVRYYGSYEEAARFMDVTVRYIRMLEDGRQPGRRLHRDICKLHTDLFGRAQ